MQNIFDSFITSLNETRELIAIYDYLEANHFDAIDYSDLLRWQWVLALSALDKLVHEIILFHITAIFINSKPQPDCLKNMKVLLNQCTDLINADEIERENIIRRIIIHNTSYEAFQAPDKIMHALAHIWEEKRKMYQISLRMNESENYIKEKLNNIVARRNQIAHQNDMLANNFEKQPINKQDTLNTINFVKQFGTAIYDCISDNC